MKSNDYCIQFDSLEIPIYLQIHTLIRIQFCVMLIWNDYLNYDIVRILATLQSHRINY